MARRRTLAENPLFTTANPGSSRMPGAFRPRVPFETTLKELINLNCPSQSYPPFNLQLRRAQSRRRGKAAIEAAATIFWALASLIAASVAAFA